MYLTPVGSNANSFIDNKKKEDKKEHNSKLQAGYTMLY